MKNSSVLQSGLLSQHDWFGRGEPTEDCDRERGPIGVDSGDFQLERRTILENAETRIGCEGCNAVFRLVHGELSDLKVCPVCERSGDYLIEVEPDTELHLPEGMTITGELLPSYFAWSLYLHHQHQSGKASGSQDAEGYTAALTAAREAMGFTIKIQKVDATYLWRVDTDSSNRNEPLFEDTSYADPDNSFADTCSVGSAPEEDYWLWNPEVAVEAEESAAMLLEIADEVWAEMNRTGRPRKYSAGPSWADAVKFPRPYGESYNSESWNEYNQIKKQLAYFRLKLAQKLIECGFYTQNELAEYKKSGVEREPARIRGGCWIYKAPPFESKHNLYGSAVKAHLAGKKADRLGRMVDITQ
jgi:hypothetical protein